MGKLREELEEARNKVARLERQMASATCAEAGHRWVSLGGCNAGCDRDCCCSVPVHECAVCKDCDYGDNREADEIRARCRAALSNSETSAEGKG